MRFIVSHVAMFLAIASTMSCRSMDSDGVQEKSSISSETDSPDAINPVFVVMGGFLSCPKSTEIVYLPFAQVNDIGSRAKKTADELTGAVDLKGGKVQFFVSCYSGLLKTGDPVEDLKLDSYALRWNTTLTPEAKLNIASEKKLAPSQVSSAAVLDDLIKDLLTHVAAVKNPRVYLFGHSYGGWSVMQVALKLKDAGISVRGLVTLDPISPVGCKPGSVIGQVVNIPAAGCTRAPSDVSTDQRLAIGKATDFWLHFYQTQFRLLHSGGIDEIDYMNDATDKRGLSRSVRIEHEALKDEHSKLATD